MACYVKKDKDGNETTGRSKRYYFRCYFKDELGAKHQYRSKSIYTTKNECLEAERTYLYERSHNINQERTNSFSNICEEYLNNRALKLKRSTFYNAQCRIRKYISSYFEKYRDINGITAGTLTSWMKWIQNQGLGVDYINHVMIELKGILKYASNNYSFNPKIINYLVPLKKDEIPLSQEEIDTKVNCWTYQEFKIFLSCIDDEYWYTVFNFMYYTGLRIGEVLALQWKNVSFDMKKISVKATIASSTGIGKWILLTPKTKNSINDVGLTEEVVKLLKKKKNKDLKIYGFNEDFFVFGDVDPISATSLKSHLNKYIKKAQETYPNLKRITPHGFRHSCASFLANDCDCNMKEVAAHLRDTVMQIERTYYWMFPEKRTGIINKMNNGIDKMEKLWKNKD